MKDGKFVLHHSKQLKGEAVYVYHMIAWYYRKNRKPFRDIIQNLGRLSEHEVEYYQNSIACLNNAPNMIPCNIEDLYVRVSNEYLSCAVGIHFWDFWKLSSVFKDNSDKKEVSTDDIAKILTVMRLVQPSSKSFSARLYQETCLPQLTGVEPSLYNKSRIFRELENIENHREELGKHIFNLAKKKRLTDGEILFYDLSSANITGLRCVMAKWGHCKDGYNTHVVLLLVITPEGYPIYWELLEGNTADAKTIEGLIAKIGRIFGKIENVICFDRGMVSDDNLKLLDNKEILFITALDGDQIHYFEDFIDFTLIKKVKKFDIQKQTADIEENLAKDEFKHVQKNLFYKYISLTDKQKKRIKKTTQKLDIEKRRYFLAFNPELAYLNHKHRRERVQSFKEWLEDYNKELSQALGDRKKDSIEKKIKKELKRRNIANVGIELIYTKYQVENINEQGKLKKATTYRLTLKKITEKSYKKARKYDGLWMLITNIPEEEDDKFLKRTNFNNFLEIYRLKQNIEESFRILSDFVEIEPFYVYKDEHIKAHFTICVLSYLIDISILARIRNSADIENMGLHNIFRILKKCKQDTIQLNDRTAVSKLTQLTENQEKILDTLNCTYLVSPKYLSDNNIISIIEDRA